MTAFKYTSLGIIKVFNCCCLVVTGDHLNWLEHFKVGWEGVFYFSKDTIVPNFIIIKRAVVYADVLLILIGWIGGVILGGFWVFIGSDFSDHDRITDREFKDAVSQWQDCWSTSIHGDINRRFLPDVERSRELVARVLFLSQLTSHAPFIAKRWELRLES